MPQHLQELEESHPDRKAWRKDQHSLHEDHEKQVLRSKGAGIAINLAKRFASQSPFFLSWSCDFRGRMYDQQTWLGRQKSDFEKALLRFAEGCNLDSRAEEWAARAVGAAYLGSRGTFAERSKWAYEHRELLEAITDNPIGMASQWEGADEPWQFLQLAIEWTNVVLRKTKPLCKSPLPQIALLLDSSYSVRCGEIPKEWSSPTSRRRLTPMHRQRTPT
jgi:DNA-directed RNA polymerase